MARSYESDGRRVEGSLAYWHQRERNWRKAGITFLGQPLRHEVFEELLAFQGHTCALCGQSDEFQALGADHDHATGELRGAVGFVCNHRVIGTVERRGHYKSERVTAIVKRYLHAPPAQSRRFMDTLRLKGLIPDGAATAKPTGA